MLLRMIRAGMVCMPQRPCRAGRRLAGPSVIVYCRGSSHSAALFFSPRIKHQSPSDASRPAGHHPTHGGRSTGSATRSLVQGIIFVILSVTGVRQFLIKLLPRTLSLSMAIGVRLLSNPQHLGKHSAYRGSPACAQLSMGMLW